MKQKITIITKNNQETKKIGFDIGQSLFGNEIISLEGDLGAGKTTLLQGLASGLGIKDIVNSPTFNILKRYNLKNKLPGQSIKLKYFYHIDAYRLNNSQDLKNLGWEEMINNKNSVIAIEWAEKIKDILPPNIIQIKLKHIDEQARQIIVKFINV